MGRWKKGKKKKCVMKERERKGERIDEKKECEQRRGGGRRRQKTKRESKAICRLCSREEK